MDARTVFLQKKGDIFVDKSAVEDFLRIWRGDGFCSDADKCHKFNLPGIFRAFRLHGIFLVTGELADTISAGREVSEEQEKKILNFSVQLLFFLLRKMCREGRRVSITQLVSALERCARPASKGGIFPRVILPEHISSSSVR